jgi:hypothetical protein
VLGILTIIWLYHGKYAQKGLTQWMPKSSNIVITGCRFVHVCFTIKNNNSQDFIKAKYLIDITISNT